MVYLNPLEGLLRFNMVNTTLPEWYSNHYTQEDRLKSLAKLTQRMIKWDELALKKINGIIEVLEVSGAADVAELVKDLNELKDKINKAENNIIDISTLLNEVKATADNNSTAVATLQSSTDAIEVRLIEVESEVAVLLTGVSGLQEGMISAEARLSALEGLTEAHRGVLEDLTAASGTHSTDIVDLRTRTTALEVALDNINQGGTGNIEYVEAQIRDLQALTDEHSDFLIDLETRTNENTDDLDTMETSIINIGEDMNVIIGSISSVKTQVDTLSTSVDTNSTSITDINSTLSEHSTSLTENTNAIIDTNTRIDNIPVGTDTTELENTVASHSTSIQDNTNAIQETNIRIDNLPAPADLTEITETLGEHSTSILNNTNDIIEVNTRVDNIPEPVDTTEIEENITTIQGTLVGVESDITRIDNLTSNNTQGIINNSNNITATSATVEQHGLLISGIDDRVSTLEQAVPGEGGMPDYGEIVSRVSTNETTLQSHNDRIFTLEQAVPGEGEEAPDLTEIESRLDVVEFQVESNTTTIGQHSTSVDTNTADINNLKLRNTNNENQITIVKGLITDLDSRVDITENDIDGLDTRITNNTNAIGVLSTAVDNLPEPPSLTPLENRMSDAETGIESVNTRIDNLPPIPDLSPLEGRLNAAESGISTNLTSITDLGQRVGAIEQGGSGTSINFIPGMGELIADNYFLPPGKILTNKTVQTYLTTGNFPATGAHNVVYVAEQTSLGKPLGFLWVGGNHSSSLQNWYHSSYVDVKPVGGLYILISDIQLNKGAMGSGYTNLEIVGETSYKTFYSGGLSIPALPANKEVRISLSRGGALLGSLVDITPQPSRLASIIIYINRPAPELPGGVIHSEYHWSSLSIYKPQGSEYYVAKINSPDDTIGMYTNIYLTYVSAGVPVIV